MAWLLSWISRPRLEQEFVPVELLPFLFWFSIWVRPESERAEHPFAECVHPFEIFFILFIAFPFVEQEGVDCNN